MWLEHLRLPLDGVCEQASKGALDYQGISRSGPLEGGTASSGRSKFGCESRGSVAQNPWSSSTSSASPSLDYKSVREMASLRLVERAGDLVLRGTPGVGKTHLAIALGRTRSDSRRCGLVGAVSDMEDADGVT